MANTATGTTQIDNEAVRVTEWAFSPGAETGMHIHEMDYVVVPLKDGQLRIIDPQGNESVADLRAGVSYYRKKGVHHNVINANDYDFAFIEVEMKA